MTALWQGIGVGLAVAAPVGPIGILCIRRTLMEGRNAGLATGLGAATADAVYGILAAAGLATTGLLLTHAPLMQVGGGLLIAVLGLASLKRSQAQVNESDSKSSPIATPSNPSTLGAFATTFSLTIANPMTILAFVGLIAGLGAGTTQTPLAPYLLVLGVFLGSALWWLGLVHIALSVRIRLRPSATRWLDAVSGIVLTTWGLWIALVR